MTKPSNEGQSVGIIGFAKSEVGKFLSDPFGYAIDRWVKALFISFGVVILIHAARMIAEAVMRALS